jgi:hypothetical protein
VPLDRVRWSASAANPWARPSPAELADRARCNICRWHGTAFGGAEHHGAVLARDSAGAAGDQQGRHEDGFNGRFEPPAGGEATAHTECPRCGARADDRYLFWCFAHRTPPGLGQRVVEAGARLDGEYRRAMRAWFDYLPVPHPARSVDPVGMLLCRGTRARSARSLAAGGRAIRRAVHPFRPAPPGATDRSVDVLLARGGSGHGGCDEALDRVARILAPGGRAFLAAPVPGGSAATGLRHEAAAPGGEPAGPPRPVALGALAAEAERFARHGLEPTALVPSGWLAELRDGSTGRGSPARVTTSTSLDLDVRDGDLDVRDSLGTSLDLDVSLDLDLRDHPARPDTPSPGDHADVVSGHGRGRQHGAGPPPPVPAHLGRTSGAGSGTLDPSRANGRAGARADGPAERPVTHRLRLAAVLGDEDAGRLGIVARAPLLVWELRKPVSMPGGEPPSPATPTDPSR